MNTYGLLGDIRTCRMADRDDEITGLSLCELYPHRVSLGYAKEFLHHRKQRSSRARQREQFLSQVGEHAVTFAERKSGQEVRSELQADLRDNAPLFQSYEAPPRQLYFLASIYFGCTKWAVGNSGQERLRQFLEDDELARTALNALARVPSRPDLPSTKETFELSARNWMPSLAWPLLAGLDERSARDPRKEERLPDDLLRRALVIHTLYDPESHRYPKWRQWAVMHRPELVAETIVAVFRAVLRGGSLLPSLYELDHDPGHAEVARLSVPSLLRAFPTRARSDLLEALASLLAVALSHCDEDEFCKIVDGKLAAKSMSAQQRIYWLCAALLRRPASYLPSVKQALEGGASQRRVRSAGEFLGSGINRHLPQLDHIDAAGLLIRRIGGAWGPFPIHYSAYGTNPGETVVPKLIDIIANKPGADASALLQDLTQDPALSKWHERLRRAARGQSNRRRNKVSCFPSVRAVI